ncbi:MAG: hypothetical protein ACTTH7_09750, partial [Treponema sp.]
NEKADKYSFASVDIAVTEASAGGTTKTELSIADISKITVAGTQVSGNAGSYTVALAKDTKKNLADTQVQIAKEAIKNIGNATPAELFDITVSSGKDKVTIALKNEKADKYSFASVDIAVTETL